MPKCSVSVENVHLSSKFVNVPRSLAVICACPVHASYFVPQYSMLFRNPLIRPFPGLRSPFLFILFTEALKASRIRCTSAVLASKSSTQSTTGMLERSPLLLIQSTTCQCPAVAKAIRSCVTNVSPSMLSPCRKWHGVSAPSRTQVRPPFASSSLTSPGA